MISQIEARIYKVLKGFPKIDLKNINLKEDMIKDLGMDSLERVAVLVSIEHEFTTVFEDRLFDNFKTLQ